MSFQQLPLCLGLQPDKNALRVTKSMKKNPKKKIVQHTSSKLFPINPVFQSLKIAENAWPHKDRSFKVTKSGTNITLKSESLILFEPEVPKTNTKKNQTPTNKSKLQTCIHQYGSDFVRLPMNVKLNILEST